MFGGVEKKHYLCGDDLNEWPRVADVKRVSQVPKIIPRAWVNFMNVYCIVGNPKGKIDQGVLYEVCISEEIAKEHLSKGCYDILADVIDFDIQRRYVWDD